MGIVFDIFCEWRISNVIAFPGIVIHVLDRSFWLSTFLFLGHHGKGNLATGLLATAVANMSMYFMEGFLSSQDVFIFQSRNIEKVEKLWLYISVIYVFVFTLLGAALFITFDLYLYDILTLKTNVTFKTNVYLWLMLPAIFFHGLQRLLQQYFTIKSIYCPVIISLLVGFISNSIGSSFIFYMDVGPLGCAISIAIAKSITVALLAYFANKHFNDSDFLHDVWLFVKAFYKKVKRMLLVLVKLRLPKNVVRSTSKSSSSKKKQGDNKSLPRVLLQEDILIKDGDHVSDIQSSKLKPRKSSKYAEDWNADNEIEGLELTEINAGAEEDDDDVAEDAEPLLESALQQSNSIVKYSAGETFANFIRYGIVGLPGSVVMAIDYWPYELACLLVAHFGTIALDTHQMLFIIAQYSAISFTLPYSSAATVRIQTLLKSKEHRLASIVAWVTITQGFFVSSIIAFVMFLFQFHIGYMYSNNMDVVHRSEKIVLFSAAFGIPYGCQMVLKGILRAANFQGEIIGLELVSMWVIGLPLGVYLAFYARPTFGLEGIWIGFLVGNGLLVTGLLVQIILLDWKKESKKFSFRLQQYATNMGNGIYLNDVALPNIANLATGGFQLRAKSLQDEIDEIQAAEFSDVEQPDSIVDENDVGLELSGSEIDDNLGLLN